MLPDNVREFCTNNHQGVLTAFRRNGAAQMSVITCGAYQDGVAFTVTETRAKLHILRRNPNCTLLVFCCGVAALRGAGGSGSHRVGQEHRRR